MSTIHRAEASDDTSWSFSLLSFIFGTLAIVALARRGITTGSLVAPLQVIVDTYAATTQLLFGWAEPYIQSLLTWLGSAFNWHLILYPHWKDVFVLSFVLIGGLARTHWRLGARLDGLVYAGLGVPGGLAAAVVTGALPVNSNNLVTQILIATLPFLLPWILIGLVAFPALLAAKLKSGLNMSPLLWTFASPPAILAFMGAQWTFVLYLFGGSAVAPHSGLAGLALSLVMLGLVAMSGATRELGLNILGGFFGAVLFFAVNAGLKLLD
jgi:hypothetical protein